MTHLSDLFSVDALNHALNEHLVVRRQHPSADLIIYNYTARCQYEKGLWSPVTAQCRGLIADGVGNIVARPFRKFFNYGQGEAPTLDPTTPVTVTDKLDGSLGVLYEGPVGLSVATRGAFESPQAIHATALLQERYADFEPPSGWTVCVEIIFPANRIVVDYGDQNDLVLLGAVSIADGHSIGPAHPLLAHWRGPRATVFPCNTLADALTLAPRRNVEGVVIHFLDSDERVKIKQEDYVALHRIVTGLNERTVWELLAKGESVTGLLDKLPDEFHGWVGEVAEGLTRTVQTLAAEVETAHSTILATLPSGFTRKDYAQQAVQSPVRGSLFLKLDGRDYLPSLWASVKPEAPQSPKMYSEDTA